MAQENRPPQIQGCHLDRLAVVYTRQSVVRHVSEHPGSTEDQGQIDLALKWGWPIERIKTLDEPLGASSIRAEGRNEFQRLLRLVRHGQVGGIFCSDPSRLSRLSTDFNNLVEQCRSHKTLVVIKDEIIDTTNSIQYTSQLP